MKFVTLDKFLTPSQIRTARQLGKAEWIRKQIIEPHIDEINKKLGQDNDPAYLSYLVEFVVSQMENV